MTDTAPNWDQGQVLTWSGKWHVIDMVVPAQRWTPEHASTLCGKFAYLRDEASRIDHLSAIAAGDKEAPMCKKCQRAQGQSA